MGRDITIAISAKDNFSDAVTKMRNAGVHFNKNLEEMQAQINAINKNRATVKMDTKEAQKNLQDIQKEYLAAKKSGDGMISDDLLKRLDEANDAYEQARRNLGLLDKSAKETEKSMNNAGGAFSKLESRAGGGAKEGLLGSLAAAGALKLGGDVLSGIASAYVKSAFGEEGSMVFSSLISGVTSGAAMGTLLGGPGIGTAVGAAAGAGTGLINGVTQIFGKEDDAYRGYVQNQYDTIQQKQQEDLTAGSSIAGQRETDQIAFSKLMGGKEEAAEYLSWVKDTANATPFLYDDLKSMSKVLATYKFSAEEMQNALLKIGDAGASLGMSSQDMGMVATGLGRMKSSGKTSLEYINLLQERGIDAIGMLGSFHGLDNGQVYDAISKGQLDGGQSTQIILKYLEEYAGAMDEQSKTLSGLMSTKEGLEQELQNAMGEGFNDERKIGIDAQNDFLDPESENGKKMQDAYRLIGVYKADLENEKEKTWRETMTAAMDTNEYKKAAAEENGAEMGRILAEAQANAENAYNATEKAITARDTELQLVKGLQENTSIQSEYYNYGLLMGKQFNKGLMSTAEGRARYFSAGMEITPDGVWQPATPTDDKPFAYGLSYVPYNDYPARLHEGERVLTASEAMRYGTGGGVSVTVTGNEFVIREDADVDRIAAEIARKLKEAQMVS